MPNLSSRNNDFALGMQMESLVLQHDFDVSVPILFFDDDQSPNACYHPGVFEQLLRNVGFDPELYHDRGTVLIGKSLVKNERSEGRWYGVSAILAHEYAHAAQAKRNCGLTDKCASCTPTTWPVGIARYRTTYCIVTT